MSMCIYIIIIYEYHLCRSGEKEKEFQFPVEPVVFLQIVAHAVLGVGVGSNENRPKLWLLKKKHSG